MLVEMIGEHGERNAEVAKNGLASLWNLAANNADNKKRIGEAGGVAIVLRMLEVHGESSAGVAKRGCGALLNLAANAENKVKILAVNGVSIVQRMKSKWKRKKSVRERAKGALRRLR